MPHVEEYQREKLNPILGIVVEKIEDLGELNYAITRLMLGVLNKRAPGGSPRYQQFLEIYGTPLAAAAEFYRLKVAPYENEKIKVNGSAYY